MTWVTKVPTRSTLVTLSKRPPPGRRKMVNLRHVSGDPPPPPLLTYLKIDVTGMGQSKRVVARSAPLRFATWLQRSRSGSSFGADDSIGGQSKRVVARSAPLRDLVTKE